MSPLKLPKSKISSSFREKQFSLLHWNKHMEKYQGIEDNSKIINHVEMAKHNNFQDAWISIQGIIYDVTEFLNYHPSGEDELMRVAGLDGTFFFNHFHSYINAANMLKKLQVGYLQFSLKPTIEPQKNLIKEEYAIKINLLSNNAIVRFVSFKKFHLMDIGYEYMICHTVNIKNASNHEFPKVYFIENEGVLKIKLKSDGKNDATYDIVSRDIPWNEMICKYYIKFKLARVDAICTDAIEIEIEPSSEIKMIMPLGSHVRLKINIKGSIREKPFTIINCHKDITKNLVFVLRHNAYRKFINYILRMEIGDPVEMTIPQHSYKLRNFQISDATYLFIANGTGTAPFISVLKKMKDTSNVVLIAVHRNKNFAIYSEFFKKLKCEYYEIFSEKKNHVKLMKDVGNVLKPYLSQDNINMYVCGSWEFMKNCIVFTQNINPNIKKYLFEGQPYNG